MRTHSDPGPSGRFRAAFAAFWSILIFAEITVGVFHVSPGDVTRARIKEVLADLRWSVPVVGVPAILILFAAVFVLVLVIVLAAIRPKRFKLKLRFLPPGFDLEADDGGDHEPPPGKNAP